MIYYLVLLCTTIIICIICRSCYEVAHFITKRYEFKNEKVKTPIKLLYISDLHETCFGERNKYLIQAVLEENPDCIIIGGDLIIGKEKKVETAAALEFLKGIEGICPILYNFGNHETRVRRTDEFKQYLEKVEKLDIKLLNNEGIHLKFDETKIYFWGLELSKTYYKTKKYTAGSNPFQAAEKNELKILIAHNPNYLKEYAIWNPDYVFSGHNHGGIVRLPLINGIISTDKKFFPKYSYGVYRENKTSMVLSAGAGTHTIKFRLFNQSEIVAVCIKPSNYA